MHLLTARLQSPSAVILEPKKINSVLVSMVFPFICHEVMGPDAMIFKPLLHCPLSLSSRGTLVLLYFHKGEISPLSYGENALRVVSSALSEVIDISPGNLDSSLCFIQPDISHDILCI